MAVNFTEVQTYLSASRLSSYVAVCGHTNGKILKLYEANLRLSKAFYPLLSLYEVILRNAINNELTTHFADPDWLINQQSGFMSHHSLSYRDARTGRMKHNHFLKNSVAKSIQNAGGVATQGKIIADLNFGFWTALFDRTHYAILAGRPIQIFTNLPPGANRNLIQTHLKTIREFRNRVYHNEPIIFSKDAVGNTIFDLTPAREVYTDIRDFFTWMNLNFVEWTKPIDTILLEIERTDCIMNKFPAKIYYLNRVFIQVSHYKRRYF